MADVEVIALGAHILDALGVAERHRSSSTGWATGESRVAYREALVAYLEGHRDRLCPRRA